MPVKGRIIRVAGPLVVAEGMEGIQMYEMVEVGEERLIGEVNRVVGDKAYIQVYESTTGLKPGEPVYGTGSPLSVELGPGLIGRIYDGIQRPLDVIREVTKSIFVRRGVKVDALDRSRKWHFKPNTTLKPGDKVSGGDVLGEVQETSLITHKVLVPPDVHGRLKWLASEGDYTVEDVIAVVEADGKEIELKMYHRWPVRRARPIIEKLEPVEPLITGMRVIDTMFPMAKGGTGAIPGPFGSGKTVTLQSLAKWSAAKVVIYIGCGERGNEMTEVLETFPKLTDPWTGKPMMERTILIANTSNMPVAAREASIYTGITLAEYYRDMGYDVLLVADSTSRWAEALREIAGRLEEMPAEEGYPSYLASRLAEFYARAGRVKVPGRPERLGSVTIVGAVSPPGGDFTEPVTANTKRFIRVFWALDARLAYSRHYPAINWLVSYSAYVETVAKWWHENISPKWLEYRNEAYEILLREDELREIVRLVGTEGLSEKDKLILEIANIIKTGFLQQNAFDPVDAFATPQKQWKQLETIIDFYHAALEAIKRGVTVKEIREKLAPKIRELILARYNVPNDQLEKLDKLKQELLQALQELIEAKAGRASAAT
ncbi:ATP synthase subunit A [Hyperthermus butylicus]|uniref:A-type ATP synthase subunit A n=1 Tax=Hyperthermus butylicus (strain DSM 5456 / JCM 9403 / PLM1-5) TaxID=415426 RepID=AATA_HYPBU|nr:ATP synthase subunit A [Hyperthermus butylicus]A2BKX6.1 RecName: Full=V-type ATP synthase alpha chain; AltName: Full=V-ATPase subunit A [Hyperthermus butylicus DSM 5456]ABM80637.1 V-type ATP synthase alpha chain [Hyperthermus butylicus DSM 5456]